MATHSSVLAWRIPGAGEPVRLPSMGSHRVGHGWSDPAAAETSTSKVMYVLIPKSKFGLFHWSKNVYGTFVFEFSLLIINIIQFDGNY